jgi:hypothetical protein
MATRKKQIKSVGPTLNLQLFDKVRRQVALRVENRNCYRYDDRIINKSTLNRLKRGNGGALEALRALDGRGRGAQY